MEQCISRVTNEEDKVLFGDGKHYFYLENRCVKNAVSNGFCKSCSVKTATKTQGARFFNHGTIDQPITENSHIFDGPWYTQSVRTYGEPTAHTIEKAMEAQKKARGGKVIEKMAVVEKPRKGRPKKIPVTPIETTQVIPIEKMIETMDEPLEVKEVITVVLRPFTYGSNIYWRDEEREKIYMNMNGKKGAYVGRWNSDKISSDSDSE